MTVLKPSARIEAIGRAHATLGLPYAEIARIRFTPESTHYRPRAGTSAPTGVNRARLLMLDEFGEALERGFPDREAAGRWLDKPFGPVGRRPPRAVLLNGRAEMRVGALAVLASLPVAAASTRTAPLTVPPLTVPPLPGPWSGREAVLRAVPREG